MPTTNVFEDVRLLAERLALSRDDTDRECAAKILRAAIAWCDDCENRDVDDMAPDWFELFSGRGPKGS